MNFQDFFNAGGGGGHRQPRRERNVDTQKLYDVLGVPKGASEKDIKRAFKKAALRHHPDRGGDPEKFKEVNKAHEILGNKEKRELYDKYGEEGVEKGGSTDSSDILSNLFGGGGGGRKGKKKGQGGLLTIAVTLEDLYNGATKKGRFNKQFFCDTCGGKGGKNVRECNECNGQGVKLVIRQLGPGMIQQMQSACSDCGGTGEMMAPRDRCRGCQGKKVYRKIHEFDVHINKGMKDKQKIPFREYGDQAPGIIPGDVYCQLELAKHKKFHREGAHLFYNKEISLVEALTGFEFTIETLDNRTLIVQSESNVLYAPGSVRAIRDEGMPQEHNSSVRGNLYVVISVKFPKHLDERTVQELGTFLPDIHRAEIKMDDDDLEEVTLEDVDLDSEKEKWKEEKASRKKYKSQLDDDEDDQPRQQQAQCQTQ